MGRMVRDHPDHVYEAQFFARFAATGGWRPERKGCRATPRCSAITSLSLPGCINENYLTAAHSIPRIARAKVTGTRRSLSEDRVKGLFDSSFGNIHLQKRQTIVR